MGKIKYKNPEKILYFSRRYGHYVLVPKGYKSDGASGPGIDIPSISWWVHDKLCDTGKWEDGTPCSNWQASKVLSDILRTEGRTFRKYTWLWSTFLFGGGKARDNGMFRVKTARKK
jgi:hypothetical protein